MAALAAVLVPSILSAQITFQRTYGGSGDDEGRSVQQTSDGGYIIAGYTNSFGAGDYDVYVIKTDAAGETTWTRTLGGAGKEEAACVRQTSDGGYIIAGQTLSFGAGSADVYLIKMNELGETLWTRTYGDTFPNVGMSVLQTADSGYVIAGYTYSSVETRNDALLIKTDRSGNILWSRSYGDTLYELASSVQQTPDGGYVLTGYKGSSGVGNRQVYIVKTDADGDTIWTKTYGGPSMDEGNCIELTQDGGYIVVGYTLSFGAGGRDFYVLRTNSVGDTTWTRTFGSSDYEEGYSVAQTDDDGFVVVGYTVPPDSDYMEVYLIKTDASGHTQWTRTYSHSQGDDVGYSVQTTSDGGYVIAGYTYSLNGDHDVFLIKTDSLGNVAVAEPKASPARAPALSLTCTPNPACGSVTISLSPSIPLSPLPCPPHLRQPGPHGSLTPGLDLVISSFHFSLALRHLLRTPGCHGNARHRAPRGPALSSTRAITC
jgi:hypothetical protein